MSSDVRETFIYFKATQDVVLRISNDSMLDVAYRVDSARLFYRTIYGK